MDSPDLSPPSPPSPAAAPPAAPADVHQPPTSTRMSSRVSPFIQKLQAAPEGYWFEPEIRTEPIDPLTPPTDFYFFYGTLMDPAMLSEVLNLPQKPTLRPAQLVGYSLKLWGQYPALIDGPSGAVVEGMVYEVQNTSHAERLAEYETEAYTHDPCYIRFVDGKEPEEISGTTFTYAGDPDDLSDGKFDLQVWLRRMGRAVIEDT